MKVTLTGEGEADADGTMVEVALDNDGDGDITYTVTDANDMTQGNTLMVSFTWEEDTMIADGMVSVGFVSADTNEIRSSLMPLPCGSSDSIPARRACSFRS